MGDKQKTWNTDPIATDPISKRNTQTVTTEQNTSVISSPLLDSSTEPNNNIGIEDLEGSFNPSSV